MARKGVTREPERIPLTEEMQNHLLALAGSDTWEMVGGAVNDWLAAAKAAQPRAKLDARKFYEDCGVFLGKSASTVRQYAALEELTRDIRIEFPQFGMAHWMLFRAQAKREGRRVWEVAGTWASTEADYAGRPVPVDVVRAALKAKGAAKAVDVAALIDQAARAVQKALDHSDDGELSGWLDRARDALTSAAGIAGEPEGDEYAELADAYNIVSAAQQRHEDDGAAVDKGEGDDGPGD